MNDETEEPTEETTHDQPVIAILSALASCIDRQPTRADVMLSWLTTHQGRNILGGQGIISAIAKETGLHRITVLLHVQSIAAHPVIGKVLKYRKNK